MLVDVDDEAELGRDGGGIVGNVITVGLTADLISLAS